MEHFRDAIIQLDRKESLDGSVLVSRQSRLRVTMATCQWRSLPLRRHRAKDEIIMSMTTVGTV